MSAQDVVILFGLALVAVGGLGAAAQYVTQRKDRRRSAWRRYQAHVELMESRRATRTGERDG